MRFSRLALLAGLVGAAVGTIPSAEARGFRPKRSFTVIPVAGTGPAGPAVRTDGEVAPAAPLVSKDGPAPGTDDTSVVRRTQTVEVRHDRKPAPTKVVVNAMVLSPEWCPTHRIVGSGLGFCDLNPRPSR